MTTKFHVVKSVCFICDGNLWKFFSRWSRWSKEKLCHWLERTVPRICLAPQAEINMQWRCDVYADHFANSRWRELLLAGVWGSRFVHAILREMSFLGSGVHTFSITVGAVGQLEPPPLEPLIFPSCLHWTDLLPVAEARREKGKRSAKGTPVVFIPLSWFTCPLVTHGRFTKHDLWMDCFHCCHCCL